MTSIAIGLLSLFFVAITTGTFAALFLYGIHSAQSAFISQPMIIWLLPMVGALTGWTYHRFGKSWPSTPAVLHHAERETAFIPFLTGWIIFIFSVLSQAFGGSTGRESPAVQMGASIAESFRNLALRAKQNLFFSRETFIRCGLSAGFGAVFGTPWAGAIFALEATPQRRWTWKQVPVVLLSSLGAHIVAVFLGANHKAYPHMETLTWQPFLIVKWLGLGVAFGAAAKLFVLALNSVDHTFRRIRYEWLRPTVGGFIVALLTFVVFKDVRFNGLGTNLMDLSYAGKIGDFDFFWKSLYTLISSGSGLKGGEVTPLMAVGACLGAVLSGFFALPVAYGTSLGLVSLFASSAHLPWTGAVMAAEFFGFEAFLPTFVICWIARHVVGLDGLFNFEKKTF